MNEEHKSQKLIQHHVKYKEIHGVDEVVLITRGEHRRIHSRLRREHKCNIPTAELYLISRKARERTTIRKQYLSDYRGTDNCKKLKKAYRQKNTHTFHFYTYMMPCVRLCEPIEYNLKTGTIYYESLFQATGNKCLWGVQI